MLRGMRWLCIAWLVGCGFTRGVPATGDGAMGDGKDAPVDAPPDPKCFGVNPFYVCSASVPVRAVMFVASTSFNNDSCSSNIPSGEVATMNGVSVCLVAAKTITIQDGMGNSWNITGTRPLVLGA